MTIANYIYIAVISGYYSKSDWQGWADKQILNNNDVEEWVYKISLAKDIDELCTAVYDKKIEECYYENNEFSQYDAVVGYYYMLYIEKRISLYALIDRLSDDDDISAESSIHEQENFYIIFDKINKDSELISDSLFIKSMHDLFEPFRKIAEEQKQQLELY
ncbi:hypothetical protein BD780_000814 [Clostridium tetanomorphum]|uniref:Uncharacterized protein n=1 Tax=Clostridium tetanomorphum TaxID=1553 RepID=A0A923J1I7_CLOTT|nr:hypothetical protein [Clostridium tetanomorphum]KAJ49741.1 hypothetical protein CTM_21523 [Clostridium tetanomorphum DSM 665]KAJ50061.1 hypothetical protein CTM_19884 [Clostridium tetanomorphum DSM 665]MBC2398844.1 hypothetical protein [Clostridium tetanomorphum]MBP1863491.1 hypothetical protein [Clostridium tetanomorphum]NRS83589.1 hypothetical protein [Clostridium tetanomorphum]